VLHPSKLIGKLLYQLTTGWRGMTKQDEIMQAKLRRAALLADFIDSGLSQYAYAKKARLTKQRIGQILALARKEAL